VFSRPDRIIVPQYEPPAGLSLLACAELLGESKRAVAASLVDLAVRGMLGVTRGERKREGFGLQLRRVPVDDGSAPVRDDLAVLGAVFPSLQPGTQTVLSPATRRMLGQQLRTAHREAVARLVAGQLVQQRGIIEKAVVFWRKQPTVPTERAHPHIDHLWGVHDYIAWAEADRLAFHQSPSGAEMREFDGTAMLHLHERLLPYAVLFGLEKQWMRELGVRFEAVNAELGDLVDGVDVALQVVAHAGEVAHLVGELGDLGDLPDLSALPDLGGVTELGDLAQIVDLGGAAEGIGAFFGGLGEFLSGIDL
jgi:hypothetical protein